MISSQSNYELALRDFQEARKQAAMRRILSRLRGEDDDLLAFEDVRQQLRPTGRTIQHGIQEIPLDKIVGSVDRYEDFTRTFLPKVDAAKERWVGVRAAVSSMKGMPPIDVYQIGDAYFVQDGNHRVSIARHLNTKTISARVIEIETRVPLTAADDPNELICKARYADFLAETNLDQLRPDADLMMSFCGQYGLLLGQIGTPLSDHAVTDWYDNTYLPVIEIIREVGALRRYSKRTETDLYVLLSERQAELEEELGWRLDLESGVSELLAEPTEPQTLIGRFTKPFAPPAMPKPGLWRQQQLARQRYHHLFENILVPINGDPEGWEMVDFVLDFAQLDSDHLLGLHVVPDASQMKSERVEALRAEFYAKCAAADVRGDFAVEANPNVAQAIVKRAMWVDFLVLNGTRPVGQAIPRIGSDLRQIIEQCPRPIFIRPDHSESDQRRALLAYDGSAKSAEALFIATYMTGRHKLDLTVVTVQTQHTGAAVLDQARDYLVDHGVTNANYILRKGDIADNVLDVAKETDRNVLFLGGFSFRSVWNLTLGSSAEKVLREFPHPVWICR